MAHKTCPTNGTLENVLSSYLDSLQPVCPRQAPACITAPESWHLPSTLARSTNPGFCLDSSFSGVCEFLHDILNTSHNVIFSFQKFLLWLKKPCFIWPLWPSNIFLCHFLTCPTPAHTAHLCMPALSSRRALAHVVPLLGKVFSGLLSDEVLLTPQPWGCCLFCREALLDHLL